MDHPRFTLRLRTLFALAVLAAAAALMAQGCESKSPTRPVLPPLSRVVVTPSSDTVQVGEVRVFTAIAYDTLGAAVPNAGFDWTSTDTRVVTINGQGRALGVGEGTAFVIAAAGGFSDSATVAVFPDTGWILQPSNANGANLNGVFFQPDGQSGWAVGAGGKIVHTTDTGVDWAAQVSNSGFTLNSVWFTTASEGWVVGAAGTVLHTTSGGSIWTRMTNVGASENLTDVYFAAPDTGWAVGSNGAIVRTFDRGGTWTKVNPTAFTLHSVAFAGTRDGWAVGDNGVILGTHDRGLTWFVVQPSVTTQSLRGVWRRSEALAFAAGQQGVTPRTVKPAADSTRWELQNAGAQFQLEGVYYPSDLIGYAVGANGGVGAVLRTDDGGVTWTPQVSHATFKLNDVFFVDPLHGWAVGDAGTIVHTARGGH